MTNLSWVEAIKKVLQEQGEPMRVSEITQAILEQKYRTKVGATPNTTVGAILSQPQVRAEIEKVERGIYRYPPVGVPPSTPKNGSNELLESTASSDASGIADVELDDTGILNAFGLFWRRSEVDWTPSAIRLAGVQLAGSTAVDFSAQVGVYLLYDGSRLVYVGRVSEPRLGRRLREHTRDRLSGRWDRFSWFGLRPVGEAGALGQAPDGQIGLEVLISTLEALLIEALEPPQNRRQGDGFAALEFIQATDPAIKKQRTKALLSELTERL
jgi:hypothetical protein